MSRADKKKKKQGGGMKALLPFLRPFRGWIIVLLLLGVAANGAALLIPRTIGQAIDDYAAGTFVSSTTLWTLVAIVVFALVASILQQVLSTSVTEQLAHNIRNRLAQAVADQSFPFIQKESSAKLLTNFTSDSDEVKVIVSEGLVTILSAMMMIFGSAAFLFSINVKLAFAAMTIVPVMIVLFQMVMRKIRTLFTDARANTDRLNKVITETIIGATLVRVLSAQKSIHGTFDGANTEARNIGYRLLSMFGSFFPLLNFISSLGIVIVIWYGGFLVIDTQMSLGEFTAFYTYLAGLITPIFILGFVSNIFVRASVAFGRMSTVLTSIPEKVGGEVEPTTKKSIVFDNVSLDIGHTPILKNISLEIPFGRYTAIIGPTAAGKTHLLYLLLGLMETTQGNITIDGVSFDKIHRGKWFEKTGVVFQDHVIFQGSLRENVALGRNASEEAIWRALKIADLESFATNLAEGLDTNISERGTNLSGGQKQRVALARAILMQPEVLLLDDFTARVDRATDQRVRERLNESMPGQTRIVVSQTIESVRDADHIIVLMEGELIDSGTHEELIKRSFEYQQIADSQKTTDL